MVHHRKSRRTYYLAAFACVLFLMFFSAPSTPPPSKVEDSLEAAQELVPEQQEDEHSILTIVTGTHFSTGMLLVDERTQDPKCEPLAHAIHAMWASWEVVPYGVAKAQVRALLKDLASSEVHCILAGSRKHAMLWSFPMSWRPDAACDTKTTQTLATKSYLKEKTKVYVNWFLLRPDLVTLSNMVGALEGIEVRFAVSVGTEVESAAFAKESCPRFNTILDKRDVYKQRLLLVAASDVKHQLGRMPSQLAEVRVGCEPTDTFSEWIAQPDKEECSRVVPQVSTHLASLSHLLNAPFSIPKTVFSGPRLVFVAVSCWFLVE
jgi:hypothetical protein